MSKSKGSLGSYTRLFLLFAVLLCAGFLAFNVDSLSSILIAIIGFGTIVLFHEFGHFIVAKLTNIHVEAFSIGFQPVLAGIKRTEKGYRIRLFPSFFKSKDGKDTDGGLTFYIGKKAKAGETEYRIGIIPFGGFVKMLGQDDTKVEEQTDDPRSYVNKSVGARMAVIAAGVTCNIVATIIIFISVFLIGIDLMPPIVGDVMADSPAGRAGLVAGDEVIEINGRSFNLDFTNIIEAAALSEKGQLVPMKVKSRDGQIKEFELTAEELPGQKMKGFGISSASSLNIYDLSKDSAEKLFTNTGLKPDDKIKSINGVDVADYFTFTDELSKCLLRQVMLLVEREDAQTGNTILAEAKLDMDLNFGDIDIKDESDLRHVYTIVPRLKIAFVSDKVEYDSELNFENGDIITAVGEISNPTYVELREVAEAHKNQK